MAFTKFLEFSGLFYCLIINVLFVLPLTQAALILYHVLFLLSSTFLNFFYFQVFVLLSSNFDIVSYLSVNVNKFFYFFNLFQKLENLQSGERGI